MEQYKTLYTMPGTARKTTLLMVLIDISEAYVTKYIGKGLCHRHWDDFRYLKGGF